jgi:hypothetical protein
MTQIATPANAYKFSELSDVQKENVRTAFGFGNLVKYFNTTKTGTDHAINVYKLKESKANLFLNDAIIESGDTITDTDSNSYNVIVKGCESIPANWVCSLIIDGTFAIVSKLA